MQVRFGGTEAYRKCKPFMIGIIAGEMLIGIVFMGVGAAYYMTQGVKPPFGYSVWSRLPPGGMCGPA